MDEGRLGMVVRQEEQHRKFVHMMNDMVRSRFGVYSNFLAREQHELAIKHVKNCVTMRRSIVRQSVLKKCLEARKQKTLASDPGTHFGRYGGQPLYAMSRDIDRVIADNHPKLRRMRRVQLAMRQSLESGAILDDETMARRMNAFFSLQLNRKSAARTRAAQSREDMEDVFSQSSNPLRRRRDIRLPPIVVRRGSNSGKPQATSQQSDGQPLPGSQATKGSSVQHRPEHLAAEGLSPSSTTAKAALGKTHTAASRSSSTSSTSSDTRIGLPALSVDSKGRLRGIVASQPIDTIHEQEDDVFGEDNQDSANSAKEPRQGGSQDDFDRAAGGGREDEGVNGGQGSQGTGRRGEEREKRQPPAGNGVPPRSKLILPPIQSSKALVSRS